MYNIVFLCCVPFVGGVFGGVKRPGKRNDSGIIEYHSLYPTQLRRFGGPVVNRIDKYSSTVVLFPIFLDVYGGRSTCCIFYLHDKT